MSPHTSPVHETQGAAASTQTSPSPHTAPTGQQPLPQGTSVPHTGALYTQQRPAAHCSAVQQPPVGHATQGPSPHDAGQQTGDPSRQTPASAQQPAPPYESAGSSGQ